ncbi:serine hydrolase domain-containing protein [Kibdelosporangium phytohabitans]|uniref:Serine hydrolase n=1 Tax=Kibdelosporangium phytohabitans TaxID=860235 RepID=A0A0N9I427_9PSEU|nr:serine hydrolase domain-containing protein [Kibdelosporangium phytohabitans]ALG10818.1 serine hydrolase [Kibdelosporangium phytohabitans]MBE1461988.1 D-alanyl-D-alanine carboxypeptidase [Kibdelosporangium phytohabitans]
MKRVAVTAVLAAAMLVPPAAAFAAPPDTGNPVRHLVDEGNAPGALAAVRRDGRDRSYVAGKGDTRTGAPVAVNGQIRIGSNTKAFTAVVVLQLVAEGKVGLDTPIDRYLPGLLTVNKDATVRQVLQHTSGLPEYTDKIGLTRIGDVRDRYLRPHDLLDAAFAHPAQFPAGAKWSYTNTNYVLAGLLVQAVTGRPAEEQIGDRIVRPLGLRDTYWPEIGETGLRGRHPHGYNRADAADPRSPVVDVTEMDPSWGWAAGQMVSTPADLAAFYRKLPTLLPAAQLAQMRTTVPTGYPGQSYGLGLIRFTSSCGPVYWGHGGNIHGYSSLAGATDDGKAAAVVQTALPGVYGDPETATKRIDKAMDKALC